MKKEQKEQPTEFGLSVSEELILVGILVKIVQEKSDCRIVFSSSAQFATLWFKRKEDMERIVYL